MREVYGVRPPSGVVVLADGPQERVPFSEEFERGVVRCLGQRDAGRARGARQHRFH